MMVFETLSRLKFPKFYDCWEIWLQLRVIIAGLHEKAVEINFNKNKKIRIEKFSFEFVLKRDFWDWKLYFRLKNTAKYISKIWFSTKRFDCSFNSIYLNPFQAFKVI